MFSCTLQGCVIQDIRIRHGALRQLVVVLARMGFRIAAVSESVLLMALNVRCAASTAIKAQVLDIEVRVGPLCPMLQIADFFYVI